MVSSLSLLDFLHFLSRFLVIRFRKMSRDKYRKNLAVTLRPLIHHFPMHAGHGLTKLLRPASRKRALVYSIYARFCRLLLQLIRIISLYSHYRQGRLEKDGPTICIDIINGSSRELSFEKASCTLDFQAQCGDHTQQDYAQQMTDKCKEASV